MRGWVKGLIAFAWLSAPAWATPAPAPLPAAATPTTRPLPISAFYAEPALSGAQLSPSGKYLAAFRRSGDEMGLLIDDLSTDRVNVLNLAHDKNLNFDWIRWKGDNRLLIGVTFFQIIYAGGKPNGDIVDLKFGRFIMAMDRDGKNFVELLKSNIQRAHMFGYALELLDTLDHDPDHILAVAPNTDALAVWKADIRTGQAQMVDAGDGDTAGWDTDSTGAVVARAEQRGRDLVLEGRAPGESKWTEVIRVRAKDVKALSDFEFLGPTGAPGQLYVAVKPQTPADGAARTVRIYDFKTHTLGPSLWSPLAYDVANVVTDDATHALLGVCYWVDTYRCDFKDKDVQANFIGLRNYFHGDRSLTPISRSEDGHWWLFQVSGPNEPGGYYLYDWQKKSLAALGSLFDQLPAERLGTMERFTYAARDGTQIPAYLTRPPGAPKGPLPLVVMPHGGPEARDNFDFDTWSQVIATRGYLVLQPNFRGSGGYGVAYAQAGYSQWGLKMQDDLTDGVQKLIDEGQADPKRICIFGGSYGGYAALVGGAQRPDLYKCVVSWAGIGDLEKLMRWEKGGLFVGERSPAYDYDLKGIGDPDADKAKLQQTSPVTYAAHYGPPVLLIHGDGDTIVPADQSREMNAALKAAGRDVKLDIVRGEDHRDWSPEHEQAAITEVANFILAHIEPAKLTTPADTAPAPTSAPAAAAPGGKPTP